MVEIELVAKRIPESSLKQEPSFVALKVNGKDVIEEGTGVYGFTIPELAENLSPKLVGKDWSISTDKQLKGSQLKPLSRVELTELLDLVDPPSK